MFEFCSQRNQRCGIFERLEPRSFAFDKAHTLTKRMRL